MRQTLLPLLLCLLALLPATATAAPALDGEFATSATPGQLTQGPDGNVWVVIGGNVARVTPAGQVTEFDPANVNNAVGITAGPDGNLWVTQPTEVARFSPADPNSAQKFTVAALADPRGITSHPDGNLYAASGDKLVRIPPANPAGATATTIAGMGARGISTGGDGRLYIADFGGNRIVGVGTGGNDPVFYNSGGAPQETAAGANNQVGYTNPSPPHTVGRITPANTTPASNEVANTDPFGITFANDGAYWVAQFAGERLSRVTPGGQLTSPITFATGSGPRYLTRGAGNTLWVSLETSKKIARITGVEAGTGGSQGDATAPTVTSLTLTNPVFRAGSLLPRLSARRRAIPTGTRIRWTVDERSVATLSFTRLVTGRRVGRRCLANTRPRRGRAKCTRRISVRTRITLNTAPGRRTLRFHGRLNRRTRLAPGRYELALTATDAAGNRSRVARKRFTLRPALRRR